MARLTLRLDTSDIDAVAAWMVAETKAWSRPRRARLAGEIAALCGQRRAVESWLDGEGRLVVQVTADVFAAFRRHGLTGPVLP